MIRVSSLSYQYSRQPVLNQLNLEIPQGKTMVLSGKSGAGKTTLARLIAGFETPDSGEIEINGMAMRHGSQLVPPHQRSVGMVFQRPALWPHMTVEKHLKFVIKTSQTQVKNTLEQILEQTGLTALRHRHPHQLSEGQARRVAIARAFAAKPDYLIMDEPLAHLDPDAKINLIELVKSQVSSLGAGLLFITHDEKEAEMIGGPRTWLDQGKLWLTSSHGRPFVSTIKN